MLARGLKGEVPTRQVVSSWASAMSILGDPSTSMPPMMRAATQYMTNYDFWTGDKVWGGPEVPPTEEYKIFPNSPTSIMARDFASGVQSATGIELSPARLETSITSIVPRNFWTSGVNPAYESARGGPEFQQAMTNSTLEMLAKGPGIRKIVGVTHPLSADIEGMIQADRKVEGERLNQNRQIDAFSTQAYNEGRFDKGPEFDSVRDLANKAGPLDAERLVNRYLRGIFARRAAAQLDDIDYWAARSPDWWLVVGGMQPKARAEIIYNVWRGIPSEKRSRFEKHVFKMPAAHSGQFLIEYEELKKQRGNEFP